jgi:hypothetical protein
MIATLTIHLHLPGCASLKEKRGRIKPLIARLHREFNVSVAEMGLQDKWQEAVIVCAMRWWGMSVGMSNLRCKLWQNGWKAIGRMVM